ncbi:MAG: TolC family protein, partial [bacterium]
MRINKIFNQIFVITHKMFLVVCILLIFVTTSNSFAHQRDGKIITLNEAIAIALENNASLNAARYALRATQHRVKKSKYDLFPKADLQFSYFRLDPGTVRRGNVFVEPGRFLVENFGQGDPNDVRPGAYDNNFSTALQVVQPIYNGGADWAAVSLARAQELGSKNQLE